MPDVHPRCVVDAERGCLEIFAQLRSFIAGGVYMLEVTRYVSRKLDQESYSPEFHRWNPL